ncbi:MAG: YVTN family beta-propeller repeat-containing protein [Rikenellaceae bacterium]
MNYNKYIKLLLCISVLVCSVVAVKASVPLYTTDIKMSASGEIVLTQKGTCSIDFYNAETFEMLRSFPLDETPTGLAIEGDKAYVTTFQSKGHLQVVSTVDGTILSKVELGSGACAPIFNGDKSKIYVCNQFSDNVMELDAASLKVLRTVKVLREPKSVVVSPNGKNLYVTNFLPAQRADLDVVNSAVSVIDIAGFTKIKDIPLSNGSNALRGMCITPDGKYVFVSHNLGRFTVPTSQLQQGWMNTSAFSIIDTEKQDYVGVILVDEPDRGAAGIWSIECDENNVYISHSGTHEISVIDHKAMLDRFDKYPDKSKMDYDLRFLYGLRKRVKLEGNGPRAILLAGDKLYAPTYFADKLNVLDVKTTAVKSFDLNPEREESVVDRGERYFNDAMNCFQSWQSCNGCHPGDGRTDGMNWDLTNDGLGNSKNCKSLLLSNQTPPAMISGIRPSAHYAVGTGFKYIQFFEPTEEIQNSVAEYMTSLKPVPSPYLVDGQLSAKALEGRKVFEKLKCDECHTGAYYTDMKMHVIGDDVEFERGWDTPTLIEVWRTAPYLFDGRAATMREVFEVHKHGVTKKLKEAELDALVEYVNSL